MKFSEKYLNAKPGDITDKDTLLVSDHEEPCDTLLPQHQNLLQKIRLEFPAFIILFIKAPRKAHRVVSKDSTTFWLIYFCFIVD